MLSVLIWWLILQVIGVLALPITLKLLRFLPDRGCGLCRQVGLLLSGYVFWLLVSLGLLQNTVASIVLVLLIMGSVSVAIWAREGRVMLAHLKAQRRAILAGEILFAVALAGFALFRAYNPEIAATEKPMEFAFINGILRSRTFPPKDPWLSGYAISYYYFGYVIAAMLTRLSGLPSEVTFNLTGISLFALTMTGAFSLVQNLVRSGIGRANVAAEEGQEDARVGIWSGLLGAAMVGLMGNLEGVLELIRARGWGSESLWRWLDIKNMPPPAASSSWYPDDAWWWWRASRVIHDRDPMGQSVEVIDEFPFFSFLLGDNHPHVLALPFVFLALALALNVLLSQRKASAPSGGGSAGSDVAEGLLPRLADYLQGLWQGGTWEIATWGLLLGAFLFLNTWDYLIYLGVFVLCFAAHRYRAREGDWLSDAIGLLILLLLIAVVLYLPFLLSFRSQAGGLGWVGTYKTRLHQYLLMMGVFIYLLLGFLAASASHWVRGQSGAVKRNVVSQVAGAAFAALALVSATQGWWTAALVLLLAGAAGGLCLLALAQPEQSGRGEANSSPGAVFALLLVFVGLMLTGFVEFLFLKDTFGTRMNTVFKFYYQAWVLLAIASVYGLQLVWRRARSGTAASKSIAGVWAAGGGLLVLAGLLYTAAAIPSKANGFRGTPTLDGTRYVQEHRPDDYGAIQWLRQHAPEDAVMLEATGGSYSEFNWVSAHTGIPTLLGWGGHQLQWRGNYDVAGQREPDIAAIYQGMDARATLALLDEYGIDYVYLGRLERTKYGLAPPMVNKFDRIMDCVYDADGVTVYGYRR